MLFKIVIVLELLVKSQPKMVNNNRIRYHLLSFIFIQISCCKDVTSIIYLRERVSFYTHLAGAILSTAGLIALLVITWGNWDYVIVSLSMTGMINLFCSSSLYHALKNHEDSQNIWRKMDHIAIYIMIAGTYTPLAYCFLEDAWRWSLLGVQWSLVVAGILFKTFFIRAPRYLSVLIYMAMGWMAMIFIGHIWSFITIGEFVLLLSGGLSYSIGAIIYGIKKPNPWPGIFGFHEIFHIFILIGAAFHFWLIILAIT
jgi:hemolysin III